jgi:predicted metalloprotease
VQNLTGQSSQVEHAPQHLQQGESGLSVRLELQADCYAGIWAKSAERRGLLEVGDIESAMNAAAAVGDDRLQRQATGTVQPEKWTHGSSAERVHWFHRGYEAGQMKACDTFHGATLKE